MREQSGRSLIEILGVLAIAGIMTSGAVKMYEVVRLRQIRMVATEDIKSIALNTKLLYAVRDNYNDISVDYLIKARVLKSAKSPLVGSDFSVIANSGNKEFAMVFSNIDFKNCTWLTTLKTDWVSKISVNGYFESVATYCKKVDKNEVAIWVK